MPIKQDLTWHGLRNRNVVHFLGLDSSVIGRLLANLAFFQINVLLQAFISQLKLEGFALMADMVYVTQVRAEWCCQKRPEQLAAVCWCASWRREA